VRFEDGGYVYLEGTVLQVLLDVGGEVLVFLHVLLHGDLALELRDELLVDCAALAQFLFERMRAFNAYRHCPVSSRLTRGTKL
jgi:hypothetical protein